MLVNVKQIGNRLGVSRGTIFRLMREGMPHKKLTPRTLRFDEDEVLEWVEKIQKKAV
ncbi:MULTISPECIES: helix-turn-helix transcriptional regulator [Paenibacillus]|uniref:helix-turn-helix transcriptional regulator n=1 Tax=Paenibacillus TaxID=44249 RepID=UPI000FC15DF6|nr:AlpA family phage regulatory protein [Paenibacillus odorifer]